MKRSQNSFRTRRAPEEPTRLPTKQEVTALTADPVQNMCVEMLQRGLHRSFSELFSLLQAARTRRKAAAFTTAAAPLLEEQRDKLETLKLRLIRAEEAGRAGSWSDSCQQRLLLAQYFSSPEDLWLRLHFYHSCADSEQGAASAPAMEAQAFLAEFYLQTDDVEKAKQRAELSLKREDEGMLGLNSQTLMPRFSRVLTEANMRLAEAADDHDTALKLLQESCRTARKIKDESLEGRANLHMGRLYLSKDEHDSAKQLFDSAKEHFLSAQDAGGLAEFYRTMAKFSESKGNTDEVIEFLEKSAEICESSHQHSELADVSMTLCEVYYRKGRYDRAREVALKCFEVSCKAGLTAMLLKAQDVLFTGCSGSTLEAGEDQSMWRAQLRAR
ncbi:tetratricopeptide repeat protein 29 isoform X2 [Oryzias melastigma]|uniref:tetratricopeptide repeat protein 29 isoform X2 n=1 Tax=Oryzias melastigma TaxID=30732 RepID=UPI000CF82A41|nr:tetratricopeptide repeat protein 29 isoform X2 [Oryzias melastigma]